MLAALDCQKCCQNTSWSADTGMTNVRPCYHTVSGVVRCLSREQLPPSMSQLCLQDFRTKHLECVYIMDWIYIEAFMTLITIIHSHHSHNGGGKLGVAAKFAPTAPQTTTKHYSHSCPFEWGKVGEASCPRTQRQWLGWSGIWPPTLRCLDNLLYHWATAALIIKYAVVKIQFPLYFPRHWVTGGLKPEPHPFTRIHKLVALATFIKRSN